MSRVTVLLPFVPEIEMTGTRRSASRIHDGGVVRASRIRSDQRTSRRSWFPVSRAVRDGETSRPARASAASVEGLRPFRADPRERDDPVPRIGRPMDRHAAAALAVVGAQSADPGDDRDDAVRPVPRRDRRAEEDQRMATRIALPVPGPPPTDRDFELHDRLEPVHVGSLEKAGLDQSHGPGRIASGHRAETTREPERR